MHYHILLTELCNAKCRYCYEKSIIEENDLNKKFKFNFSSPASSKVSIEKLKKFLSKDKSSVLIFYGGEPLLEIKKIKQITEKINLPFRMQTNAKLLNKLPIQYLKKIGKILVSIDGTKERTDYNKGQGTYDLVMKNINQAKNQGYSGEITARMTISPPFSDICEQVISLINAGFTSIHWQLDAGFYKHDFNEKKFLRFTEEYDSSVSKLLNFWIDNMKKGKVLKLYPFLAITYSLLKNEPTKLRCGAGYEGYAITTDGKIVACPIMNCIEDFKAGDLDSNPDDLKKFDVKGRCDNCRIKNICGGRCLYWNKAKLWPEKGDDLICKTIKHLISEIQKQIPAIKGLIQNKIIQEKDFEHEGYWGPEIIP